MTNLEKPEPLLDDNGYLAEGTWEYAIQEANNGDQFYVSLLLLHNSNQDNAHLDDLDSNISGIWAMIQSIEEKISSL